MYCLVVMLCKQIDDFLILNDDPIKFLNLLSLLSPFYNTAIKSFVIAKTARRTLPVFSAMS